MKNIRLFWNAFSVLPPAYHEIFFPPSKLGEPRDHWRYPQIYGKWYEGLQWLIFGCLLTFLCITPPLPWQILFVPLCFLLLAVWSFYRSLRLGLISMVRANLHVLRRRELLLEEARLMDKENGTPPSYPCSITYDVARSPHYYKFWHRLRQVLKKVEENQTSCPTIGRMRGNRIRHLKALFREFGVAISPDGLDELRLTLTDQHED